MTTTDTISGEKNDCHFGAPVIGVARSLIFIVVLYRPLYFWPLHCLTIFELHCALNVISTFLLLSLVRYLCWSTISSRWYHLPNSQCLGSAMGYLIYLLLKVIVPKYVFLLIPQACATLADFVYLV